MLGLRVRRAIITTGSNGLASLLKLLVAIISVPLLITYLGVNKYGIVVTITSMAVWLSTILDGGGGLSLKNALVTEKASSGITSRMTELTSSTFCAVAIFALFVGVVVTLIIEVIPLKIILNVDSDINVSQVQGLLLACAWIMVFIMLFSLPRSIYSAIQKEYLFAPWSILGSVIGLLLLWLYIKYDYGLIPVASAILFGTFLAMICATLWFQWHMKAFRFSWKKIRLETIKEVARPGASFLVLQIAAVFIFQADIFLVNLFLGQTAAAVYSVHFQLFIYFQILAALVMGPFWPALGEAYHKGEYQWFKNTILVLAIGLSFLFLIYAVLVNAFGKEILSIWTHQKINWQPELGFTMSLYYLLQIITSIIMMSLNSVGIIASQVRVVVIQAILNIVLAIGLIHKLGIIGVVVASILSYLLTVAWFMPFKLHHFLKNLPEQRRT